AQRMCDAAGAFELDDEGLWARATGARLAAPVCSGEECFGFLLLGERITEEPYRSEELDLITTIAGELATRIRLDQLEKQRSAAARAHALESELASVVRHAHEGIVSWGADGHIISWNPAAELLYRIPEKEAIGLPVETLVPEWARPAFRHVQQRLLSGE